MTVDYLSAINQKGSGLNTTQIVNSLVEAEVAPEKNRIDTNIENKTVQISSLAEMASELSSLKSKTSTFSNTTTLQTASASTSAVLSVTNSSNAKALSSDIRITQLATSQTLEFSGFTSPASSVGSGTINVDFGNWITNGTATDTDSLFTAVDVNASTSLGTPTSHTIIGGLITIATAAGGNQNSTNFVVVGTDMAGNAMTETITGAGDGATATGSKVFKNITSITPGSTVGSGKVTIGHSASTFGPNTAKSSLTSTISSSSNSLQSVATSLNALTGVAANIINKGDGTYSLVVRSDTGAHQALKLTVSESASDTGLSTFDTTSDNGTHQTTASTDATLLVDGVSVSRATNTITDLFDGHTLDITATTTTAFRVSSSLDKTTAFSSLKSFIDNLNATQTKFNLLTKKGSLGEDGGPLSSNIGAKTIQSKINKLLTGAIEGYGDDKLYLSQLGVSTQKDGTLSVNEKTFNTQLDLDSTVFDAIFNSLFSSNSDYVKVEGSSANSDPKPGRYNFSYDGSTATLDSYVMTSSATLAGTTSFVSSTVGDTAGIRVTPSESVTGAYVYYGKSLIDQLAEYIDTTLSSSGLLTKSETTVSNEIADLQINLENVQTRSDALTIRYKSQFAAMESAVTSLKSTGDYLTNMMDSWNKD